MMKLIALLILLLVSTGFSQPVHARSATTLHAEISPQHEATFAYFPSAVPISVLAETMRRDRILHKNLSKLGITLSFHPFAKGNDVLPLIRERRIAAVSVADMPAIEAAITGDMLIIGLAKQSYSSIVAPISTQVRELRKKRIGNAHGSTSHYALLQALASAGLTERDVTLVPMAVGDMPEALALGRIDAFAAWEPIPTVALKKYPGRFAQIGRQTSYSFFLISNDLNRSHPDAAREITAGLIRAIRWLKKSESNLLKASHWALVGAQNFAGRLASLNEQDIARITHSDLLDLPGTPIIPSTLTSERSLLLKEFDFLKQIGKLPASTGRDRLMTSFRAELISEIVGLPSKYDLNRFDYAP